MLTLLISRIPTLFIGSLLFMDGIIWHLYAAHVTCIGILCGITLITSLPYDRAFWMRVFKIIPFILCACLLGAFRSMVYENHLLQATTLVCHKKISCSGIVTEYEPLAANESSHRLVIELTSIEDQQSNTLTTPCCINIITREPLYAHIGDHITIENIYIRALPAQSNVTFYLQKQGIIGTAYVSKKNRYCVHATPPSWSSSIQLTKNKILASSKKLLSPATCTLFSTIFLGHKMPKDTLSDTLRTDFQIWGISHYLARAGLHLVMFMLILHFFISFFPLPLFMKRIVCAASLLLYTIFSWSNIPYIRAIGMASCYLVCSFMHIASHALHAISLAALTLLLYNPLYLVSLDFQLSFAVTLAFILINDATTFRHTVLNTNSP